MVKALVSISVQANRVLNIIKAEYGLKDKSEAIDKMAEEYEELVFEPKVKPSYIKKLKKYRKEKVVKVGSMEDFEKRFNLNSQK